MQVISLIPPPYPQECLKITEYTGVVQLVTLSVLPILGSKHRIFPLARQATQTIYSSIRICQVHQLGFTRDQRVRCE